MSESLLTVTVISPDEPWEAEPVRVVCEDNSAMLELWDGTQLVFVRSQLHAALMALDAEQAA